MPSLLRWWFIVLEHCVWRNIQYVCRVFQWFFETLLEKIVLAPNPNSGKKQVKVYGQLSGTYVRTDPLDGLLIACGLSYPVYLLYRYLY